MQNRKDRSQTGTHWFSRPWVLIAIVLVASVLVAVRQPLMAADARPPLNQTVPPATPRPDVPPPSNDNNDDENNDNNNDSGNTGDTGGSGGGGGVLPAQAEVTGDTTAALTGTNVLTAVVDVVTLNVRQGPGTSFPVIGKLAQGNVVGVLAVNTAGDWWLTCCLAGTQTSGWVSAALLAPSFTAEQAATLPVSDSAVEATPLTVAPVATATPAPVATLVPGSLPGTVAGVNLNVRSAPGTDSTVVGKLRASDTVSVLGRNEAGDWLYICCVGTPAGNGWVSAQFITPAFGADELDVVAGGASSTGSTSTTTTTTTTAAESTNAATGGTQSASGGLSLAVSQQPPFAVQGREIALIYTVRNAGGADLADVTLRSELPAPLTLVGASAAGGTVAQNEAPLVEITWPSLAAGASATATVRVRVADDVPNGTTFANLATVTAGGQSVNGGITIGMPPSLLPEFW